MKEYLKHYRVKITVLSPIHIGGGKKIGKKEYIYMPWNDRVIVPDLKKMYGDIRKKGLEKAYIDFMLNSNGKNASLNNWLRQNRFRGEDYEKWKLYEMDGGEVFATNDRATPKEIDSFVKDAYGMPYVPGSSIKGMFRTALLAWDTIEDPEQYESLKREMMHDSAMKANRKNCMAGDISRLEQQILHTLNRKDTQKKDAVNDCLSGLHVGDSDPVSTDQLTLSQKIDYTLEGEEKPLPLLRETLVPGTELYFDVSIDTQQCPYDMSDIIAALESFQQICNQYFYSRFHREAKDKGTVWLGGGCGFLSKTVMYPLFEKDAVKVVDNIFKNTLGKQYSVHKHQKDMRLKLAPHVCKCTRYQGKLYNMGMGQISYEEC